VVLVNLKNPKHKVVSGKISGRWGVDKFHGSPILEFMLKVDIVVAHVPNIPLMHPHEANDQALVRDVVGTCTLWNWRYVKVVN
jgi:hypothetical protein